MLYKYTKSKQQKERNYLIKLVNISNPALTKCGGIPRTQKLKGKIEIGKLEERYAAENEQLLYTNEKLYNYVDFSKPTEVPKFEYYA